MDPAPRVVEVTHKGRPGPVAVRNAVVSRCVVILVERRGRSRALPPPANPPLHDIVARCPAVADGPVSVTLTASTTAAQVRLEVAAARVVKNSFDFVLLLAWSRRRGTPFKGNVLADDDLVLRRMHTIEAAGGRCRLSIHVRAAAVVCQHRANHTCDAVSENAGTGR